MRAYILDENDKEGSSITVEDLKAVGVLHWSLDADNWEQEGKLDQICKERGYTYKDFVNSTKIPDLPSKLKIFFEEHLHTDEEIRFFLDGSGFFDVRGKDDKWIRIVCSKGDLIILPAGIYHRFNPDEHMFFHVMRLFVGEPVWTPYNRNLPQTDDMGARKEYLKLLGM